MVEFLKHRSLLILCFFASGATSLVYQVLWTRRLSLIFGHTVMAISTVVALTMAGLGAGAFLAGRRADKMPERGLRSYSLLEAFIGLWALLSLPLFELVERLYLGAAQHGLPTGLLQLVCVVGSVLILFPPTTAMGATLPVFCRSLSVRFEETGELVSKAYGANTAGAFVGAALTGFLLLPGLGLWRTLAACALINFLIAALARALDGPSPLEDSPENPAESPIPGRALWAFALWGGASMVYQVGWTRGLILSLGSSTYAFAAILAVFLAGLGAGSLLYSTFPQALRAALEPAHLGGLMLLGTALAIFAVPLLGHLPFLVVFLFPWTAAEFTRILALQLGLVLLVVGPPCLLMGLTFPAFHQVYVKSHGGLGQGLGRLYGANTLGCIVGALAAGFWLIPGWGAQGALKAGALLGLVAAGFLCRRGGRVLGVLLVAATLALPPWNEGVMAAGTGVYSDSQQNLSLAQLRREVLRPPTFYRDGISTTVSVHVRGPGEMTVRVNGKVDASLLESDRQTMLLAGYLGGFLQPESRSAAVIGLGSGMTLEALSHFSNLERIDCAELEPAMLEANRYWSGYNGQVLSDPRVRVHLTDGRTFIKASPRHYDLIVSEPSNPWIAGVANLYTVDFFQDCKSQLQADGVMVQWFHFYGVSPREIAMVFQSFFKAFPYGSVWMGGPGDLLLVGSQAPVEPDLESITRHYQSEPRMQLRLFEIDLFGPDNVLGHRLLSRERALEFLPGVPLHTDDRPLLEFLAPIHLFEDRRAVTNLNELMSHIGIPPATTPASQAQTWVNFGAHGWVRHWLAQNGRSPQALLLKARLLDQLSGSAQAAFQEARAAASTEEAPLVAALWAEMELRRGRGENAAKLYRLALESPGDWALRPTLLTRLGQVLLNLKRPQEALEALEEAVGSPLATHTAHTLMASALTQLDRPEAAQQALEKSLTLNPHGLQARLGAGYLHLKAQRYQEAAVSYGEAVELVPDNAEALVNLGSCYSELGRADEAAECFERALFYHPDHPVARHNLEALRR